ncbi:MAG: hypothetical protein R3F22_11615 [Lysobacteraceae bacterium]
MNVTHMDQGQLGSEDNRLLQAWRSGELSAAEAEALETRLFFEPELATAASIDQDIQDGFAFLERNRPAVRTSRAERLWPLLAAASIGAMAVLVPVAYHGAAQHDPGIMSNVEWVRLDHVRSSTTAPTLINPSAGAGALVMELPAPGGEGPFEARIVSDADATLVFTAGDLHPVDGALTLLLPRNALKSGDYRIELRSVAHQTGTAEESLRFRFQP